MNKVYAAIVCLALVLSSCGGVVENPVPAQSVNLVFDSQAKDVILDLISNSSKSIGIQLYQLGDENVIEALANCAKRGASVRLILFDDPENTGDKEFYSLEARGQIDMEEFLEDAGCQVRWIKKREHYLFHRKVAVFDGKSIFIGSSNWTRTGLENNSECDAVIVSPENVEKLLKVFDEVWGNARDTYTNSHSR